MLIFEWIAPNPKIITAVKLGSYKNVNYLYLFMKHLLQIDVDVCFYVIPH